MGKKTLKPIADWGSSEVVVDHFRKMTQDGLSWNDITLTSDDKADYYLIINRPFIDLTISGNPLPKGEVVGYNGVVYGVGRCESVAGQFRLRLDRFDYEPEKSIVVQMEPKSIRDTWEEWASPDPSRYLFVYDTARYHNAIEWHLNLNYEQLSTLSIDKYKTLSAISSDKKYFDAQKRRLELSFELGKSLNADVFGRGISQLDKKDDGLLPYKYSFAAENNSEKNYFTEKLVDCILAETLCFYWGCPNIADFIDERAYICVDIYDFEKSLDIIRRSIAQNEWEKRINIIRREKKKILDEMQIFPCVERIINMKVELV